MNIEKELKTVIKEAEEIIYKKGLDIKFAQKNLDEMNSSFDAFNFLIYGSFLGLVINLFANIIHDYFSKFSTLYFFVVLLLLFISLIILINFVIKKWKQIQEKDKLIKDILNLKEDPGNYVQSMQELKNRAELILEEYSKSEKEIK